VAKQQNTGVLLLGLAGIYFLATSRRAAAAGPVPGGDATTAPADAAGIPCRPPQRIPDGGAPGAGCKSRWVLPIGYRPTPMSPGISGPGFSGWSIPEEWYPGMLAPSTDNGTTNGTTNGNGDPQPLYVPCEDDAGEPAFIPLPGPGFAPAPGCNFSYVAPSPFGPVPSPFAAGFSAPPLGGASGLKFA